MVFCGKCGAENPEDGQFCYRCGAALLSEGPSTGNVRTERASAPTSSRERAPPRSSGSMPRLPYGYVWGIDGDVVKSSGRKVDISPGHCGIYRFPAIILSFVAVGILLYMMFGFEFTLSYGDGSITTRTTLYDLVNDGWSCRILDNGMLTALFWITVVLGLVGLVVPTITTFAFVLLLLITALARYVSNDILGILTYSASLESVYAFPLAIAGLIVVTAALYCAEVYGRQFFPGGVTTAQTMVIQWRSP